MFSNMKVSNAGVLGDRSLAPLAFGGHCLYVRKCVTGNATDDFWERDVGGIIIPQECAERSQWVSVLGTGPQVGKPCGKHHMNRFHRARTLAVEIRPGDMVMCPNGPMDGLRVSPLCDFEYFVEESLPFLIWRPTEN